jgi:dihydroorotase
MSVRAQQLYTRNVIFQNGVNPHYYCLPILKGARDRAALLAAATSGERADRRLAYCTAPIDCLSGSPKFFAGTDSAPHARGKKECCGGSAGCFTSFACGHRSLAGSASLQ